MTRDVEVSDNWSIEQENIGAHDDRERVEITHNESGVSIVAKEQPNGAELRLQIPADLPGGYDVVHEEEYPDIDRSGSVADDELDAAISELERFAAMYDHEGTFLIEGAPVLH